MQDAVINLWRQNKMSKEYKIEIKVKNNLILQKIKSLGFETVGSFCKKYNLCPTNLGRLVNLNQSAVISYDNSYRKIVFQLCDIFMCSPEDLFTDEQKYCEGITRKDYYVGEAEAKFFLENNCQEQLLLEDKIDNETLKEKLIPEALSTLTSREQEIIKMRFEDDMTYRDIGLIFGISGNRIMQIEGKALRKLRHSSRTRILTGDDKIEDFWSKYYNEEKET
jgi:RNA polymerase sigma factor (sigma-70 family)